VEAGAVRSDALIWLSVFLLLPLAGLPLLLHPAFRRFSPVSRAILAGGAGAVLISFSMTAFAILGVPWSLPGILISSLLVSLALRFTIPGTSPPSARENVPGGLAFVAFVLAGVAVAATFVATGIGAASSPDLIFFWGPKAQQNALAGTVDARFLAQPFLEYMHPYYPPLVTNLYALASMAAGRMCWTAATYTFPLLLAALALGLPGVLRTGSSRAVSASVSTLIVCTVGFIGIEADVAGNGDMPLLFFETLAMALLVSEAGAGAGGQLLAGLLLAGAAATKLEGLPFALAAAFIFLLVRRKPASPGQAAIRLGGPTILTLGAWFAFGASRHLFIGYPGEGALLDPHPGYWKVVLRSIGLALFETGHGLPYLVPLVCLLLLARQMTRRGAIPLGVAAAVTATLLLIYMDHPSEWISWSAARVFAPVAMLFALAATCVRGARDEPPPQNPSPTGP
jgi:hypothetical protein